MIVEMNRSCVTLNQSPLNAVYKVRRETLVERNIILVVVVSRSMCFRCFGAYRGRKKEYIDNL